MRISSILKTLAIPVSLGAIVAFFLIKNTEKQTENTVMSAKNGFDRIEKAESALNKGIHYQSGHLNNTWFGPLPTNDLLCDCVQFVAWVCGVKGVYTTTWIQNDALTTKTKFRSIPEWRPGCVIVGDIPNGAGGYSGHTAILLDKNTWSIIDCSHSKDGVYIHNAPYWASAKNVVYAVPITDIV